MSKKELLDNIDELAIGLDETFQFHCTQCGQCCVNREDILLNPRDVYKIAQYLKMEPREVLEKYCETYIGENSRMPIIRLLPVGKIKRCPFLKNCKCEIHEAKPSVCAIYPLGRYTKHNPETDEMDAEGGQSVHYLLQPVACGDMSETHTVRDWLKGFDLEVEDKAHILWTNFITRTGRLIRLSEEKVGVERLAPLWSAILIIAYLTYDTTQDFLPQFEENLNALGLLYEKLDGLLLSIDETSEQDSE